MKLFSLRFGKKALDPARDTRDHGIRGHVPGHHCSGPDSRPFADLYAAQNRGAGSDGSACPDDNDLGFPGSGNGPMNGWVAIINEANVVANEHIIFNGDVGTNKGVRLYPHPLANHGVPLNLNEMADSGLITNAAPIQISMAVHNDAATKFNIIGNRAILPDLRVSSH
jgi:hypothetical protein